MVGRKSNPYEEVDYCFLRCGLLFRGLALKPESLSEEDALLFGPVGKRKMPKHNGVARVP